GSSELSGAKRVGIALRYADLAVLLAALPVFLVAGWPKLGYAVAAGAWLAQRVIHYVGERRSARALAAGDRRRALGAIAISTLARVWLVTLSVLLVGVLADHKDGLAAAVLTAALVTVFLASRVLSRLFAP